MSKEGAAGREDANELLGVGDKGSYSSERINSAIVYTFLNCELY